MRTHALDRRAQEEGQRCGGDRAGVRADHYAGMRRLGAGDDRAVVDVRVVEDGGDEVRDVLRAECAGEEVDEEAGVRGGSGERGGG